MSSYTYKTIPIQTLSSGREICLNVHTLQGSKKGPNVYIQASVHGSELQGNLVIRELLKTLKTSDINGKITIVPMANPMATENKVSTFTQGRFHPETGDNWNRLYQNVSEKISYKELIKAGTNYSDIKESFKLKIKESLESSFNEESEYGIKAEKLLHYQLQLLASDADIVLDFHTGPKACEYIYSRKDHLSKAKDLNFPFYIEIPNEFAGAMDEACFMPWIALEKECNDNSIPITDSFEAYTIELGSEEIINSPLAKSQAQRILNYLSTRKVIEYSTKKDNTFIYSNDLSCFKSYYCPNGGLVEYLKVPGEKVNKGEVLFQVFDFDHQDIPQLIVKALNNCYVINHNTSSAASQGTCLYQVLEIK